MAVDTYMIAVALGEEPPADGSPVQRQWDLWISDAMMLIETRKAALGVTDPIGEVKQDYVVREAVIAHIKRPEDVTQVTVSVDDGSTSKLYKSGSGRVSILDEWWALLGLTDPKGAFSLDMVGVASVHLPWCSLNFGALYCSCGVDIAGYPIFEGGDDL